MKKLSLSYLFICFAVITSAINIPTPSSPANGISFSSFTTMLSCGSVSGATGYQFQLDTTTTFGNTSFSEHSLYGRVWAPTLRIGKTYFWRVRCYNSTDTSLWSLTRNFTVSYKNVLLNTPANNSSGNIVQLIANNFGSDSNVFYQFEVDTVPTLSSSFKRSMITSTNQFIDTTFFAYNQNIYWRSRCFSNLGDTFQWSSIWKYTTHNGPTWSTTGAITITDPTYLTVWNNAGISGINIQLDTSLSFNTSRFQEHFIVNGATQDSFKNLIFGKDYYLRLRGYYGAHSGPWSSPVSIRIKSSVTILNPENGNVFNVFIPSFNWSRLLGCKYHIQIFSDRVKSGILKDTVTELTTYTYTTPLDLGKECAWRIRAFHEKDTTPWVERYFKIYTGQVNLSYPANNSNINTIRPKIGFIEQSWGTQHIMEIDTGSIWPSRPSLYYIRIDTFMKDGGFSYIDTTLLYGQKYIWRVYAMKGTEQAEPSYRTFTIKAAPSNYYPPNNFIGTGPQTNGLVTGIEGSTYLQWEIDTTALFNSKLRLIGTDLHIPDDLNTNYIVAKMIGNLLFHTKYYWRTRCISIVDTSNWSTTFNFVTTEDVWLSSPTNAATNIPITTKLNWGLQGNNFSSRYQYQIATDSLFDGKPIITLAENSISETTVNLNYDKRYFWRARVFHSKDTSRWSPIYYFNTVKQPVIGSPALVSPNQGAQNIPLTPVVLRWNPSTNALNFDVEVSTTEDFSSSVSKTNITGSSTQITGLQPKTKYYWRVRGRNGEFFSTWATRWFETTSLTTVVENQQIDVAKIFPNPALSSVFITTKGVLSVEISDLDGKIMFERRQQFNEISIDVKNWKSGLYIVKITDESNTLFIHKLWVKQ